MIPMKMAELKASVDLDKLDVFNKDLFRELQDKKPTYRLLFEKNIPKLPKCPIGNITESSNSRGSKTHRSHSVSYSSC